MLFCHVVIAVCASTFVIMYFNKDQSINQTVCAGTHNGGK